MGTKFQSELINQNTIFQKKKKFLEHKSSLLDFEKEFVANCIWVSAAIL